MLSWDDVKDFERYAEYYPDEDEPGFDGVHYGGLKGLKPGAPDSAIEAYARYMAMIKEAEKEGIKL